MAINGKAHALANNFNIPSHARFSLMALHEVWTLPASSAAIAANETLESDLLYLPARTLLLSVEVFSPAGKSDGSNTLKLQREERGNPGTWTDVAGGSLVIKKGESVRAVRSGASDNFWTFRDEKDWNLRFLFTNQVVAADNDGGDFHAVITYANT